MRFIRRSAASAASGANQATHEPVILEPSHLAIDGPVDNGLAQLRLRRVILQHFEGLASLELPELVSITARIRATDRRAFTGNMGVVQQYEDRSRQQVLPHPAQKFREALA